MTRRWFLSTVAALIASASMIGGLREPTAAGEPAGGKAGGFVAPERGNGRIAFTSTRTGDAEIFSMQVDGKQVTNLSNDPGFMDAAPAWSPDGSRIAFTSSRTGDNEIFVMAADGSNPIDITNSPGGSDTEPNWSPDGAQLAFTSDRSGNEDIWVINSDGSSAVNVTLDSLASDTGAAWSPDGTRIAFTSDRSGDDDVWVMDSDGSNPVNLSNNPAADSGPAWSPDATRILFASDRAGGNSDIYVMLADGTGQTDLFGASPDSESHPVFSPDGGARIVYTVTADAGTRLELLNFTPAGGTFGDPVNLGQDPTTGDAVSWEPLPPPPGNGSPIQHVVLVMMENHDFDNVLGYLCVQDVRCDGATTGQKSDGSVIPLARSPDMATNVDHSPAAQKTAIAGGEMNGFDQLKGCKDFQGSRCYVQYYPDQTPNLAALARAFAISDRTFENDKDATWVSHLQLLAAWRGGFVGRNPFPVEGSQGPGWGCDSFRDARWQPVAFVRAIDVPSCVPSQDGSGPYRETSVPWMPTILDRLERAGISYALYVPPEGVAGYQRAVCPSFANCIYGTQGQHVLSFEQFATDASVGSLPAFSVLIPSAENSQHPPFSMLVGDNWIGDQLDALMTGPAWETSAVFITYDDCGCFYDHVPPPPGWGIRIPMVIVSPYARPGYTDSNVASFASMLAYVEHTYGLAPLGTKDASAYDYAESFDYSQKRRPGIPMVTSKVPQWELRWLRAHPPDTSDEP